MRVLNIEDSPIKHKAIKDVLESCRITEVDNELNLEDGVNRYKEALSEGNPYDLIISDMWYPPAKGVHEERSGHLLVKMSLEEHWEIPIIICSNQNYDYPEIFGTLYYSENEDWEGKLRGYIKKLKR